MFLALILFHLAAMQSLEVKSPLYQHLPNCENYFRLSKKTDKKVGVCVLAKDEEGFLSEFVAYYVVHGIDHVIIYDDNSTDSSIKELEPWIRAGFASVRLAGTWNGWLGDSAKTWGQQMKQKKMMERNCKMTLYDWGYHYHISVDVDEYEVPFRLNVTLADEIDRMFTQNPTRGTFNVNKLQFNALPHILEPFDKLTIEAYQNRFHGVNKFNPKKSLMQKSVYRIRSPLYSNETLKFVLECCTFHSCKQGPIQICWELQKTELSKIFHAPWPERAFVINHYARSLEKFTLKQRTWKQHVKSGYDISRYFERSHGFTFDNSAVRYACQVRELIANVTGVKYFVRSGNWIRKYEYNEHDKNPYIYTNM